MLTWMGRQYRRRIVNVNVNILLANVLALGLTAIAVHFSRYLGIDDTQKWTIVWFTLIVDLVIDVAIYYGLHWVANHWPGRWWGQAEQAIQQDPQISFLRDATRVQLQRMALAVVFYGLAVGGHKLLLLKGLDRVASQVIAYGFAILVTRVVHTLWMLRNERMGPTSPQLVKTHLSN